MALTIQTSPNVGAVGAKVEITIGGTPTAVQTRTITPELRFYIRTGPATSKLPTLDQFDELEQYRDGTLSAYGGPLDINTTRESLRLKATDRGASFEPDVPGLYTLEVYDVSAYAFVPRFGGNVPASGELAATDNEEAALPGYAGGIAQAPSDTASFYVYEEKSRVFGVSPHTATLTIRTYGDTMHLLDPDRVRLVPANTPLAKMAASSRDVARVLADWKKTSANLYESTVARLDATTLYTDGNALSIVATAWHNHVQTSAGYALHGAADNTNTVAGSAVDLATAIVRLNNLRTAFNAHVILTAGSVHAVADGGSVVATAACTNLQTALDLWRDLRLALSNHGDSSTAHVPGIGVAAIDGNLMPWTEPPQNLAELLTQTEELVALYDAHRIKTSFSAPHANADASNDVTSSGVDWTNISKEAAYALINQLADALERHSKNLDVNSVATTTYHTTPDKSVKVATRASDDASAANTLELLIVQMERHFTSTNAHGAKTLGAFSPMRTTNGMVLSLAPRLSRAWYYATAAAAPLVPANVNPDATYLGGYGWTLPHAKPSHARQARHMTASADFELSSDNGSSYAASNTSLADSAMLAYVASGTYSCKARLTSTADVVAVLWSITTADDEHVSSLPTVTQNADKTCSFSVPKTGGAWIVKATVTDGSGVVRTNTLAVKVAPSTGNELIAAGEGVETGVAGWVRCFNDLARNALPVSASLQSITWDTTQASSAAVGRYETFAEIVSAIGSTDSPVTVQLIGSPTTSGTATYEWDNVTFTGNDQSTVLTGTEGVVIRNAKFVGPFEITSTATTTRFLTYTAGKVAYFDGPTLSGSGTKGLITTNNAGLFNIHFDGGAQLGANTYEQTVAATVAFRTDSATYQGTDHFLGSAGTITYFRTTNTIGTPDFGSWSGTLPDDGTEVFAGPITTKVTAADLIHFPLTDAAGTTSITNAGSGTAFTLGTLSGAGSVEFESPVPTGDGMLILGVAYFNGVGTAKTYQPTTTNFTIHCWVKFMAPTTSGAASDQANLFGKPSATGGSFGISVALDTGKVQALIDTSVGGPATYEGGFVDTGWNHLAITYDGANVVNYVNAIAVTSNAKTGTIVYDNTKSFFVGNFGNDAALILKDVKMLASAMTQADIKTIFTRGAYGT